MSIQRHTLLDLARLNGDQFALGLIEEAIKAAPEFRVASARLIPGTQFRTVIRTGFPAVGFRNANEGVEPSKSKFDNRLTQAFILSARVEVDKAVATAHIDGPAALQSTEAAGVLESALISVGSQFYYGTASDPKGFPGLISSYDADSMTVDAGGASDKSSVWFVRFGERDAQFVLGQNTPLIVSEWREESLADLKGKKYPGLVADLTSWIGLQVISKFSAARIKNLGSENGKGLTDDLGADALDLFPAGSPPTHVFMTKRSRKQLRKSRATSLIPTPPLPTELAGIPIVVTDSLTNTETE